MADVPESRQFDCLVVGGGLAGLIAGRNVARKGVKVCVLEARERLGGRCWTREFPSGTGQTVELGGEWLDAQVHEGMLEECKHYGIPVTRANHHSAWNFAFPGRKVLTRCVVPNSERPEYDRVIKLINEDLARLLFKDGYDIVDVEPLDVRFKEYIDKRLQTSMFMRDYLLAEAFTICGADCELHSALVVLHNLAGYGPLDEIFNTKPRSGNPFTRRHEHKARLGGGGTTELANKIAEELIQLGGEIKYQTIVAKIACEEVPKAGSERFCGMCTLFTYPFCSTHGPRVLIYDGLGTAYRARTCILAIPLNCIPCIKFSPLLPEALQHSAEVSNIGNCKKVWISGKNVGWDVDDILSWPGCPNTYVKSRFPDTASSEEAMEAERVGREVAESFDGRSVARRNHGRSNSSNYDPVEGEGEGEKEGEENGEEVGGFSRDNNLTKPRYVHVLAAIGLDDLLSDDKEELETTLRRHHPTLEIKETLTHNWKTDRWARGTWLAVRAGGARLHATASADARKPWPHTFNLVIAGSDVSFGWSGWMEGAVQSGRESAAAVNLFLFPVLPEGRWMRRIAPGEDVRHGAK